MELWRSLWNEHVVFNPISANNLAVSLAERKRLRRQPKLRGAGALPKIKQTLRSAQVSSSNSIANNRQRDSPCSPSHPPSRTIPYPNLDALVADYFAAIERSESPDRQRLIADHPELASELAAIFHDLDQVQAVAAPLQLAGPFDETLVRPNPLPLSETIRYFGEYELLEEIARGMGVVYKAKQASLNRIVALKMVLRGTLATPVDIARFKAEAEAAAQLDHPHIVPIYEVGEQDGRQYFTMKLIDGSSLSKVPRGSVRDEVARLKLVVEAVQYAHQHGILHRDLKPGNILVDRDGVPYVIDFGLAKRLTDTDLSLTETNQLIGPPLLFNERQRSRTRDLENERVEAAG